MITKPDLSDARLALLRAQAETVKTNAVGRTELIQHANVACMKARRENRNITTLHDRGWPAAAVQKAGESGDWSPPSFAQRMAEAKFRDEMPELINVLRWCVEDILASDVVQPRQQLESVFAEFVAYLNPSITKSKKQVHRSKKGLRNHIHNLVESN